MRCLSPRATTRDKKNYNSAFFNAFIKKLDYDFLKTMNPVPIAPKITHMPIGDAGAGVALGQGVGTFAVDFMVVVVFSMVAVGIVVTRVVSVTSGLRVA